MAFPEWAASTVHWDDVGNARILSHCGSNGALHTKHTWEGTR
jgi:hypothetical protein